MIPVVDNNHTTEALAYLTDMFKQQPNINGLLAACIGEIQQIEVAAWTYLNGLPLLNAVGSMLDQYGAIVDFPRNGMTDADYLTAILLQIRINNSQGRAEDIIQISALLLPSFTYYEPPAPGGFYNLNETPRGVFAVQSYDQTISLTVFIQILGRAKPLGIRGLFEFTTWSLATTLIFDDETRSLGVATSFPDHVSGSFPNLFCSGQQLSGQTPESIL